jgi:hypothetical protein
MGLGGIVANAARQALTIKAITGLDQSENSGWKVVQIDAGNRLTLVNWAAYDQ